MIEWLLSCRGRGEGVARGAPVAPLEGLAPRVSVRPVVRVRPPVSGLPLLSLVVLLGAILKVTPVRAERLTWDTRQPIPLGLQASAQAVLRLPEPLSGYIVDDPAVLNVVSIDEQTLAVSPRSQSVDVRIIVRGDSGNLYVTRASTALRFTPVLEIDLPAPVSGPGAASAPRALPAALPGLPPPQASVGVPAASAASASPASSAGSGAFGVLGMPGAFSTVTNGVALMARMMRDELPQGFRRAPSSRLLLQTPELRVDSEQVWISPDLTGIVATARRVGPTGRRLRIAPERIEMQIPELGEFRLLGANHYLLDDAQPSTRVFLVFARARGRG